MLNPFRNRSCTMKEPKAGEKLSEKEATEYVDYLYKALYKYAHEKIYKGAFMTQLRDGKLPLPVMRQFFKNWGHFSLEVNALNAVSYYTHLPFFVRHFDLLRTVLRQDRRRIDFPQSAGPRAGAAANRGENGLEQKRDARRPVSARGARNQRLLPQDFYRRLHRRTVGTACLRRIAVDVVGPVVHRADDALRI